MDTRSDQTLIDDLRELTAALDRPMPRIEREAEHAIARDARELRRAALKRICELGRLRCGQATRTVAQGAAPCGYTLDADHDGINLYYGAGNTSVALAKGSIGHILGWLDRHGTE